MMTSPIQNADIFPATNPDRMFRDAPPCFEQLVTSRTCRELVLVNTFVNSGMSAPATVPQLMITESTHHRAGWALPDDSFPGSAAALVGVTATPVSLACLIEMKRGFAAQPHGAPMRPRDADDLRLLEELQRT